MANPFIGPGNLRVSQPEPLAENQRSTLYSCVPATTSQAPWEPSSLGGFDLGQISWENHRVFTLSADISQAPSELPAETSSYSLNQAIELTGNWSLEKRDPLFLSLQKESRQPSSTLSDTSKQGRPPSQDQNLAVASVIIPHSSASGSVSAGEADGSRSKEGDPFIVDTPKRHECNIW
jgi:hypothetical protein